MIGDFELIVSSFRQQYGIRIKSEDFASLNWDEFCDLLNGLNEDTPLARVIQIRQEKDPNVLKGYTAGQRKIRSDWQKHLAGLKTQKDTDQFLKLMQDSFKNFGKKGE